MLDRLSHVAPVFRVAVVAVSALGLLGLGVVLVTGAMRGDAVRLDDGSPAEVIPAGIPPMDRAVPDRMETATFAMG